jgi:predicted cupin superfamily sugar epimerase
MNEARLWIERLGLVPHQEGGYYREIYRSPDLISPSCLPPRFPDFRTLATSIYYLLPGGQVSFFHRLRSDEIWNFFLGSRLTLAVIRPSGKLEELNLGREFESGEVLQAVVPAGQWFGAFVAEPDSFSLAGCTLSPGFDFEDFELGARDELLRCYPQHRSLILKLTR